MNSVHPYASFHLQTMNQQNFHVHWLTQQVLDILIVELRNCKITIGWKIF